MPFPAFRTLPCFYSLLLGVLLLALEPPAFGQAMPGAPSAPENLRNLAPENQPKFPGGASGLQAYFRQALRLPAEVKSGAVQGEVLVRCVIRADGQLDSVRVVRALSAATDQEALRVVRAMPAWQAGMVGYPLHPAAVDYLLHVPFPLPGSDVPWPRQGSEVVYQWIPESAYFLGGAPAFVAALAQHFPPLPARASGQVHVAFVVDALGQVRDAKIEKGLGAPYDDAILGALGHVPRFVPGVIDGQTVTVLAKAVIPFGSPTNGPKPSLSAGGNQRSLAVFGGSMVAQERAIRARLRYPATALRREVEGTVVVGMLVSATGTPEPASAQVLKSLGDGCDEEALRVIRDLPAFKPALRNGEPVAEQATFSVPFALPPPVTPPTPLALPRPPAAPRPKARGGR